MLKICGNGEIISAQVAVKRYVRRARRVDCLVSVPKTRELREEEKDDNEQDSGETLPETASDDAS